jgi:hypothetical protein
MTSYSLIVFELKSITFNNSLLKWLALKNGGLDESKWHGIISFWSILWPQ